MMPLGESKKETMLVTELNHFYYSESWSLLHNILKVVSVESMHLEIIINPKYPGLQTHGR